MRRVALSLVLVVGGVTCAGSMPGVRVQTAAAGRPVHEAVAEIVAQLQRQVSGPARLRVAVGSIVGHTMGSFVEEDLRQALPRAGRFDVIERRRVARVVRELNRGGSPAVGPELAAPLRDQLGADAIVSGRLTDLGDVFGLEVRLTSTADATTLGTATSRIAKEAGHRAQSALSNAMAADEAVLARLRAEAQALARANGCPQSGQCRAAPVGAKECGGPRGYIVYCPLTTDTAALFRKLDEFKRADQEFSRKYQLLSDCMVVMEPGVELVDGSCRSAPPSLRPPGQRPSP